ncbi:hypothetical protein Poli38472_002872 [Pythium oligandrum]|uniref:Uncharacterized protein n=1 Tax=Pythium oligandrum TaxID=41045 RepID=A0A8K1C5K8_PYTOL|nr:hypothetical protein Poli38472_002872 [Pythium oligandrum]|eukprot:TMW56947.1 hypothetical protein Poli38472_002872 [Pythium oligandrum]
MAKRRAAVAAAKPTAAASSHDENKAVARPNAPLRKRRSGAESIESQSSAMHWLASTLLPNVIMIAIAYAAVTYGYTTSPAYVRSTELLALLKKAFIALVCLTSRTQLADVFLPPNKTKTLRLLVWAHIKGVIVAILANCAGSMVIKYVLGLSPQYQKTAQLVVPIYFSIELAIGLGVPQGLFQFIVGFMVSWLKAVTVSSLVTKWFSDSEAHPAGFILVCTANLFASGIVLRFVGHYHRSRRVVSLSFGLIWSILQMLFTGTAFGLLALVANHFSMQEERQVEAAVLYYAVAWYAMHKYWKAPLRRALTYPFEPTKAKKA